jgi:uncharacterized protein (TIGR02444 family)
MSNPLWDYSLAIYGLEGVASACLELQDAFGLDVNVLLYAAWLANRDQRLDLEHLTAVEARIADWRAKVIQPVRALRRELRGYPPAAALCAEVKSLELRAEREQHDTMYAFHQEAAALSRAARPLRENLALVARFAGPEDAGKAGIVERLLELLPQ